jgi:hypothetical protein
MTDSPRASPVRDIPSAPRIFTVDEVEWFMDEASRNDGLYGEQARRVLESYMRLRIALLTALAERDEARTQVKQMRDFVR